MSALRKFVANALSGSVVLVLLSAFVCVSRSEDIGGWGVDALLSRVGSDQELSEYIQLLKASKIMVLRERGPLLKLYDGSLAAETLFPKLKSQGFFVVAFAENSAGLEFRPGEDLPVNLEQVFQRGRELGLRFANSVDAWEMVGEADVGYCKAMPDRLAAFQKALYLGIKVGSREAGHENMVLMGALALPPGQWMDIATQNDLLDYTDAYNMHYYGPRCFLKSVIDSHYYFESKAMERKKRKPLPIWITECGFDPTVAKTGFFDSTRREIQATELAGMATDVSVDSRVDVFMPFILRHDADPFALTITPRRVFPAFSQYSAIVRKCGPLRSHLDSTSLTPSSVVLQWLPDTSTVLAEKLYGSYTVTPGAIPHGIVRIYNLGKSAITGKLSFACSGETRANCQVREIQLGADQYMDCAVEFVPMNKRHFGRTNVSVSFDGGPSLGSHLMFRIENSPIDSGFNPVSVRFQRISLSDLVSREIPLTRSINCAGDWTGMNGIVIEKVSSDDKALEVKFTDLGDDPLYPPFLIAGLPLGLDNVDCIKLIATPRPQTWGGIRIDVVDKFGARYCIFENFGISYHSLSTKAISLRTSDFAPFFFGQAPRRIGPDMRDVRELQLRLYPIKAPGNLKISLEFGRLRPN